MKMTTEIILQKLKKVEHPEISCSLYELGMLADVGVDGNTAIMAMAFPTDQIPQAVVDLIIKSIQEALSELNCETEFVFFDMTEQDRQKFFTLARANWKGAV